MTSQVLVIADMINDFLDPQGSLYVGEAGRAIIPFVAAKVREERRQGKAIIFVGDAHDPDDREFRRFPPHGVKGTWGAEVIPELEVQAGDYLVEKTYFSGLLATELENILNQEKAAEVHLLGVCTSICIMETARDLDLKRYRVIVFRDGVADLNQEDHEWALERMMRLFGVKVI
jgi:nicotinamidase/pyrazinamidase